MSFAPIHSERVSMGDDRLHHMEIKCHKKELTYHVQVMLDLICLMKNIRILYYLLYLS